MTAPQGSIFYVPQQHKIDTIVLDCTVSATHTSDVTVTQHPVEQGFAVTDHVRKQPQKLTLTGIVSNTPLGKEVKRSFNAGEGIVLETIGESGLANESGYAEAAFQFLEDLRSRVISIETSLRVYDNMTLTNLTVPKDKSTGEALKFTAQFVEIRVVQNKLTTSVVTKDPKGKGKATGGKKVPKTTEAETEKKSIAYQLADSLGLLQTLGVAK